MGRGRRKKRGKRQKEGEGGGGGGEEEEETDLTAAAAADDRRGGTSEEGVSACRRHTGTARDAEQPATTVAVMAATEGDASEKISLHSFDDDDDEERLPPKELTWREKLSKWMSTNKVQYTIIFLVVLDSIIVIFELLIDMDIITIPEDDHHELAVTTNASAHHHPPPPNSTLLIYEHSHSQPPHPYPHHRKHNHSGLLPSDMHTPTPTPSTTTLGHNPRLHHRHHQHHPHNGTGAGGEGSGGGQGHGEGEEEGQGHDGVHHTPNKHLTEEILHMASLTILTIFLVEVILKILAEGKHLLKHKAEVFDAVVVIVSFTMDVIFTIVPVNQATQDYSGLLVLLRLWRVTRIINGVILSVKMEADKKLNAQKALRAKAEKQVKKLSDKVDRLMRENEKLRARLAVLENRTSSRPSSTPSDVRLSPQKESLPATSASDPRDDKELTARASHEISPSSPSSSSPSPSPTSSLVGERRSSRRGRRKSPPIASSSSLPQGQTVVFRESGGCLVSTSPPGEATFYRQCRSSSLCTPPESQQLLPFGETVSLDIRDSSSISRQQAVVSGVS
ncbi:hypothetical protein ACOMHN_057126 [Nucella lapillus]